MTVRSRRLPLSHFAAGLLIAAGLCSGSANAQVIVNDKLSMGKQVAEFSEQAKRWSDTVKQYQQQLDHYNQQLIKLQRLRNFRGPVMADNFGERPSDYGLEEDCPGAAKSGLQGMIMEQLTSIAPNMGGELVQEQMKVCARIVMAQNAQYNASVQMIRRLIERNNDFKEVEKQRDNGGTSQGGLAANDNEVQRFVARNAMELDYWQAQMKAYDSYILALKQDQTRLARTAMDGGTNSWLKPLGQVVQAAALKKALSN